MVGVVGIIIKINSFFFQKPPGYKTVSAIEIDRAFFYAPRPLIDRAPGNDVTSLTTYTTHTRVGDTRKKYIYIVRTRGKAIIGMALRAIKSSRTGTGTFKINKTRTTLTHTYFCSGTSA